MRILDLGIIVAWFGHRFIFSPTVGSQNVKLDRLSISGAFFCLPNGRHGVRRMRADLWTLDNGKYPLLILERRR